MNCLVLKTQRLLGKKWTVLILQELYHSQKLSFNQLSKKLNSPTNKIISGRLRELEKEEILQRVMLNEKPLSVRYTLTRKGKDLLQIFNLLKAWGNQYQEGSPDCININCNQCRWKKET